MRCPRSVRRLAVLGIFGTLSCGRIGFDALDDTSAGDVDAQVDQQTEWLRHIASDGSGAATTGVDGSGNVIMSSSFEGTLVVEGGDTRMASAVDTAIVSYDSTGTLRWSQYFSSSSRVQLYQVFVTPGGETYGTGLVAGTVDLGGQMMDVGGRQDVLIAKLDTNGVVLDADAYDGGGANAQGHSISANSLGSVVVGGVYRGGIDFGGGPFEQNSTDNGYVITLDEDQNHVWSKGYVSSPNTYATAVDLDDTGTSCVGGFFEGPIDDFGDAMTYDVVGGNDAGDAFIAQYDAGGILEGLAFLGSIGADRVASVARVEDGCIVGARVCGASAQVPIAFGQCDPVLAKVALDGSIDWVVAMGAGETEQITQLEVGASGTIYFGGFFQSDLQLGSLSLSRSIEGGNGAFVGAVDKDGNPLWLQEMVGDNVRVDGLGLAPDESFVMATGIFRGSLSHAGRTIDSQDVSHAYLARINVP